MVPGHLLAPEANQGLRAPGMVGGEQWSSTAGGALFQFTACHHKVDSGKAVAGPRPNIKAISNATTAADPWMSHDPWSNAKLPSGCNTSEQTQNRSLQGPVESRFSAQDARMMKMEQAIEAMQSSAAQMQQETQRGFEMVQEREKQIHATIAAVRNDLEQSMKSAIASQSAQLSASIDGLKELLVKKSKRSRDKDNSDMSE